MITFSNTPVAPVTTTFTSAARSILDLADRMGFEVTHPFAAYRGADEFNLSQRGGYWGVIVVGTRTGRILRAAIYNASNTLVGRADGTQATRALLNSL
jgi:hypothetical protein